MDYIKDDIYRKLDVVLDDLKIIQAYIHRLKHILCLIKEHAEQKMIYIFIKLIAKNKQKEHNRKLSEKKILDITSAKQHKKD